MIQPKVVVSKPTSSTAQMNVCMVLSIVWIEMRSDSEELVLFVWKREKVLDVFVVAVVVELNDERFEEKNRIE
ncbi:hypothetical protein EYC84_012144 [Monilinia fructicola]|uniref:Uncharacterized protein n=1 Tax=Monilinia fructicola TaxID=38448 RepID=A0A5M9J4L0_MONFR|nr:hypothetical protein EYC84_012144 [Monilinia fructicola]